MQCSGAQQKLNLLAINCFGPMIFGLEKKNHVSNKLSKIESNPFSIRITIYLY